MDAKEEMQAKMAAQGMVNQEDQMKQMQEQRQKQQAHEDQKKMVIKQVLEPDAVDRLTRIGLANADRQKMIEGFLIMQIQQGKINKKLDESALIRLIEGMDDAGSKAQSVTIQRKKRADDSDDEIDIGED